MSELAKRLRERHWAKAISELVGDGGAGTHWVDHLICNQDGTSWPCFTEQTIREVEKEE